MNTKLRSRLLASCVAGIALVPGWLAAQEEPTTQPSEPVVPVEEPTVVEPTPEIALPAPDPEPSAEEIAALEVALEADAESEPLPSEVDVIASTSTAQPAASNQVSLDIAFILDVAGAWFSVDEPLQVGEHDPNVTGFTFQQLEMSLGASVDPYFRFDANLAFSPAGVEVEEAYASTTSLPGNLKVRAGQFLTKFGRLNPSHPHSWGFLDRPLASGKFHGSEGSRGVGAELSWLTPLPWYADVIGGATMANGRSFFGGEDLDVRSPTDLLYTTRVEQFFPLGESLSLLWGISAQFGPNSTGPNNRTEIYGSDLYLRYRPLQSASRMAVSLQLEGMLRARQVPDDVLQDVGARAELIWTLTPRWEAGARYELVTGVDADPLDPEWDAERQRVSAQVTFRPSHFSRIRLQPNLDLPSWHEDPIYSAMLGLEVLVGAHGAHNY